MEIARELRCSDSSRFMKCIVRNHLMTLCQELQLAAYHLIGGGAMRRMASHADSECLQGVLGNYALFEQIDQ